MQPEVLIGLLVVAVLVGVYFYNKLEKDEDLSDLNDAPAPKPVDPIVDAPVKKAPAKRAPKTAAKAPAKKPATKKAPAKPGKKKLTVAK